MLNYFSLFWGASSLGEWSIAVALRGTLVVCALPSGVERAQALKDVIKRERISVFGAVPSLLDAMGEAEDLFVGGEGGGGVDGGGGKTYNS